MDLAEVVVVDVPRVIETRAVPFVVLGPERGGMTVLQTALSSHSHCYCHSDVLHPSDKVRRRAHEAYFGPEEDPVNWPDYCAQVQPDRSRGNPERYLDNRALAVAAHGERALGVKLLYPHVWHSGLWEYLEERTRRGDLAVIHLTRNPLACFVSRQQAQSSGIRQWKVGDPPPRYHAPAIHVDVDELVAYARRTVADAHRVRDTLGSSLLELTYSDLTWRFAPTMDRICRFLELPMCRAARPGILRLPNRPLRQRVANFDRLKAQVPLDVRRHFEIDLF